MYVPVRNCYCRKNGNSVVPSSVVRGGAVRALKIQGEPDEMRSDLTTLRDSLGRLKISTPYGGRSKFIKF
jgi:hypothetical protein